MSAQGVPGRGSPSKTSDRGGGDTQSKRLNSNGAPKGLKAGGRAMWAGILADHPDLDRGQLVTLEAACRQRDRADSLAEKAAAGDPSALRHEREASLAMARLVAALRLPDPKTGKRPQLRSIRGVHQGPTNLSALERARRLAEGA